MIGKWDESNCVLALAPASWKLGNGGADKTDTFPIYPSANKVVTWSGVGAGYGYDTDIGQIILDGVNDCGVISNTQTVWDSTGAFSIEMITRPQITDGTAEVICSLKDFGGIYPFRLMFVGDIANYLGMSLVLGAAGTPLAKFGYGNKATYHNIKKHIVLTYNGSGLNTIDNWALYHDGSAVSLTTYTGAAGIGNDANYIATNNPVGYYGQLEFWWKAAYNVALSPARVAANYALGDSMGLKGNNVGSLMNLTAPVKSGFPYAMFMKGA